MSNRYRLLLTSVFAFALGCPAQARPLPAWAQGEWVGESMVTSKDIIDYDSFVHGRAFISFIPEMSLSVSPYRIQANRQLSSELVDGAVSAVRPISARFYDLYHRIVSADVVGAPLVIDVDRHFEYVVVSFKSCTIRASHLVFEDREHAVLRDTRDCRDTKLVRFPDADHLSYADNGEWDIYRRVKPQATQAKR